MANSNTFNDGSFMLFGVRITPTIQSSSPSHSNSPRECTSVNTIAQCEQQQSHQALPFPNRECKRGVPWTAEEHKLFLKGLNEGCKGNWKGISKNFVKTRTPTQIASHAQKYFKRITNLNCQRLRRRHRSSVFDITTDMVNCRNEASPIGNSRAETLYASI